jgi:hypothetical protein
MTGATATELQLLRFAAAAFQIAQVIIVAGFLIRRVFKKQWPFKED